MKVVTTILLGLGLGFLSLKAERLYSFSSLKEGNSFRSSFRSFLLAEDEVYVSSKAFSSFRLLQKRLKENWPGAILLEEKDSAALVRLGPGEVLDKVVVDAELKRKLGRADLLPVLYLRGVKQGREVGTRRIVTGEVLVKAASEKAAKQLSQQFGWPTFVSTQVKDQWMFHYTNPLKALEQVEAMHQQGVEAQVMLAKQMSRRFVPNDKFYERQWHLKDRFTTQFPTNNPTLDINVEPAWDRVTGSGVLIGIVDDGLETKHLDLKRNAAFGNGMHLNLNGKNITNPKPKGRDYHGTACAGVAAAMGNNRKGVVGVAFNAGLVGIRLIAREFDDQEAATALSWQKDRISIYSNSWGPNDNGKNLDDALPGIFTLSAIEQGVQMGRAGKGSLFFWAAGNGRRDWDNSNYDGYANLRYVIAVGAYDKKGEQAYYSESGANIVVAAPSDGLGTTPIYTTDLKGKKGGSRKSYLNFGGTSAATPQAAGVAALMLESNPNLGWRDVKEILIGTANRQELIVSTNEVDGFSFLEGNEKFVTNGAGFAFSHSYGAGRLDAAAAVNKAATWINLGPEAAGPLLTYSNLNLVFSDTNDVVKTFLFTTNFDNTNLIAKGNVNLRVETVAFTVDVSGVPRDQLIFELTSPSGMQTFVSPRQKDKGLGLKNWTFSSVRHWGEKSQGVWTLRAKNLATNMITISENDFGELETNKAEVVSMGLQIFGTKIE